MTVDGGRFNRAAVAPTVSYVSPRLCCDLRSYPQKESRYRPRSRARQRANGARCTLPLQRRVGIARSAGLSGVIKTRIGRDVPRRCRGDATGASRNPDYAVSQLPYDAACPRCSRHFAPRRLSSRCDRQCRLAVSVSSSPLLSSPGFLAYFIRRFAFDKTRRRARKMPLPQKKPVRRVLFLRGRRARYSEREVWWLKSASRGDDG